MSRHTIERPRKLCALSPGKFTRKNAAEQNYSAYEYTNTRVHPLSFYATHHTASAEGVIRLSR